MVTHITDNLIGTSPAINALRSGIESAASSDAHILLTGESGTGREIIARLIHRRSARRHTPLVTFNCAGVSESLLESELFGHVFAGANGTPRSLPGLLEMADGGTVFLGDVCEMSLRMQARLLRVIESGEIQRVGSDRVESAIDVRIIAATSRELDELVASKAFREDLYCRLNAIEVRIPPLRSRREDIPVLLGHFLHAYSEQHGVTPPTIAPEVMRYLVEYEWLGNDRQLKQVVERLIVRAQGSIARVTDLPPEIVIRQQPETHAAESASSAAIELFDRMAKQRESFWSVVYPAFMARDLTRSDLRLIVRKGLQETVGSYKMLVELLNMQPTDYRRFLSFLRKHGCHVPFQRFRTIQPWHRDVPDGAFSAARVAEHSQPPDSMQR